jgi:hypothetical protein
MKTSTIAIIICGCLSIGYGLYTKYFARIQTVYSRISKVKQGMTRQQVTAVLSTPDSVYWEHSNGDSLLVMAYAISDTSSSTLQIKLREDSVRAINYKY